MFGGDGGEDDDDGLFFCWENLNILSDELAKEGTIKILPS